MLKQTLLALTIFSLSPVLFADAAPFSYDGDKGPDHWGSLDTSYAVCQTGKAQSPINITGKMAYSPDKAVIHYEAMPLNVVDDENTELTIGSDKVITNTGHGIQVNMTGDRTKETLTYRGTTYYLKQFHFHTPAETQWNGFHYPAEIHFVHQSDDGKVAVIAVFLASDQTNATLSAITNHLPTKAHEVIQLPDVMVNVGRLLPQHTALAGFSGSLTTPPCTEGLQWLVYQHPITASDAQLKALAKIMGNNARPIQPLNGRVIESVNASIE